MIITDDKVVKGNGRCMFQDRFSWRG